MKATIFAVCLAVTAGAASFVGPAQALDINIPGVRIDDGRRDNFRRDDDRRRGDEMRREAGRQNWRADEHERRGFRDGR
jgi:hypothetical protein